MQIALISTKFNPFGNATHRCTICEPLADALSSLGHSVKTVVPLPVGMNPDTHSLARRLNPIEVELGGDKRSFIRYDGHISSGVEVYLLEVDEKAEGKDDSNTAATEAFCRAALSCLDSQPEPPACCLSFDAEIAVLPSLCRARKIPHLMVVETLGRDPEIFKESLPATDRVVFLGNELTGDNEISDPLSEMLQDGRAVNLPWPVAAVKQLGSVDKTSRKAAFQIQSKLPVRTDVPLVFFSNPLDAPFAKAMEHFLTRDAQVVVATKNDRLTTLRDRYPDRIALSTSDHSIEDHLHIADGCVVEGDSRIISLALAHGTVPITDQVTGAKLVDLEPNLQSGSGIVVPNLTEDAFSEGLGRFVAAYGDPAFPSLVNRLPTYAPTWSQAATHCLQLIEELGADETSQTD